MKEEALTLFAMNFSMLNRTFALFSLIFLVACAGSADTSNFEKASNGIEAEFFGRTQGTTYRILCHDRIDLTYEEIEGILRDFDFALSAYIPNSILSKINESSGGEIWYNDYRGYFNRCYRESVEVWKLTGGAFDPTIFPLVETWGFFDTELEVIPDSAKIDSLRSLIGFKDGHHFSWNPSRDESGEIRGTKHSIVKNTPGAKLDFNGIAQGLAVDVISEELERKGAENYFVEIGGEIRAKGRNSSGNLWRIGIDKPIEDSTAENRRIQEIVELEDRAIATSGSYRRFYERDGVKYSHTIDPQSGYPVTHSLLSATVVSSSTALSDGLATGFMVMGRKKVIDFVNDNPDLEIGVYLIYMDESGRIQTWANRNFEKMASKDT